ncbi:MAG: Ig-like domain-containing protein, partial [Verrucomicrobiota bacterium]
MSLFGGSTGNSGAYYGGIGTRNATTAATGETVSMTVSVAERTSMSVVSIVPKVYTATTTTLASSVNPSVNGQAVTYTATVNQSAATGTVNFYDGATLLGSGTLSGGSPNTATYANSSLSVGSHSITATYAGDGTYASSTSSSVSQTVNAFGTANKLVMKTAPSSSVTAGAAFGTQSAVFVEDQYGNVVTGDNSTVVTATVGTGTGPLTGTLTATASGGTATFGGLAAPTLAQSGLKLTFTSGVLTSAVDTTSITVTPGAANKLVITGSGTQTAGSSQNLTFTAKDDYGNTATTYTGNHTLTFSGASSSPGGTAPTVVATGSVVKAFGVGTIITFSSGVATVSGGNNGVMRLYAAETATISTTDGSISSSGADNLSVTVSAASASKLAFTTQPANTTAGATMANVVVQIQDTYGNAVAQSGTAITLSGATLYGGTNPQNTDTSGKATFNDLVIRTAATGLQFTASGGSLAAGTSSSFNITAGTANKLVMKTSPSSSVTAGVAFGTQPAVYVEDSYGNVVTGDNSTVVTATVGTGTGPLTGTLTATISGGTATFSGLAAPTLAQAGLELTFTSSGLTSAVDTTSITITAGTANKLVMKTSPSSSVAAGAAFGTQPAVYVEDSYGNVVTGDNSTVVTATVGTGTGPLTGTLTATASGGTATFGGLAAPTLAQSGLKLTFTSGSLTSAVDTTSITVTAGTANALVLTPPAALTVSAGVAFGTQPAVYVEDSYGNVVTGDNSTVVTATVGTGTGPLTGTLTAT